MPQLLRDPVTGMAVVVAPSRAQRPHSVPGADTASCPFCPGNEAHTPPELARIGAGIPDDANWRVRVVPNRYPVVTPDTTGVAGDHEVIVIGRAHDVEYASLDDDGVSDVFGMFRDRTRFHAANGRAYVLPFMNQGPASGASLEHPHAQLVALDHVPPVPAAIARHFARDGDLLAAQVSVARADARVVVDVAGATLWCPPASTQAFEFVVSLAGAGPRLDEAPDDDLRAAALGLRHGLAALDHLVGGASSTIVVVTAPLNGTVGIPDGFRWHVRVYPRLSVQGGFELGTGYFSNALGAVDSARALRYASGAITSAPPDGSDP